MSKAAEIWCGYQTKMTGLVADKDHTLASCGAESDLFRFAHDMDSFIAQVTQAHVARIGRERINLPINLIKDGVVSGCILAGIPPLRLGYYLSQIGGDIPDQSEPTKEENKVVLGEFPVAYLLNPSLSERIKYWKQLNLAILDNSDVNRNSNLEWLKRWGKKIFTFIDFGNDLTLDITHSDEAKQALYKEYIIFCRSAAKLYGCLEEEEKHQPHVAIIMPTSGNPIGTHHIRVLVEAIKTVKTHVSCDTQVEGLISIDPYSWFKRSDNMPTLEHRINIARLQTIAHPSIHVVENSPTFWFDPFNSHIEDQLYCFVPRSTTPMILVGEDVISDFYSVRPLDNLHPLLTLNHVIVPRQKRLESEVVVEKLEGRVIIVNRATDTMSSSQARTQLRQNGKTDDLDILAHNYCQRNNLYIS